MNSVRGITLIELLISFLLVSIMMDMLLRHYLQVSQHYHFIESQIDEATEIQVAGDLIREHVRKAGFTPCLNLNHLETLDHRTGQTKLSAIVLPANKQYMLSIHRMSDTFGMVQAIQTPTKLAVSLGVKFNLDYPIVIADCAHAEVHTIVSFKQEVGRQWVELNMPLAFEYYSPIYIGQWIDESFFIKADAGLFYKLHHTDELTPLVKIMTSQLTHYNNHDLLQVILGVDKNHTVQLDTFVRSI